MTGIQLANKIKSTINDLPVIILTGFSNKIEGKRSDMLGIDGILMKPIIKSELAQMVRNVLDEAKKSQ